MILPTKRRCRFKSRLRLNWGKKMSEELTNNVEYRQKDDQEFLEIKEGVGLMDFIKLIGDKNLENIRLPLNNKEAYQYLRWINEHYVDDDDGNFLNYILNLWDAWCHDKPIRPPTPRELAIVTARRIVKNADDKEIKDDERGLYIDFDAEMIRDAYRYWNYHVWITSGLAGCIMKWGTFENNVKPGDEEKYITYEEEERCC